jgi:hypothetical protein
MGASVTGGIVGAGVIIGGGDGAMSGNVGVVISGVTGVGVGAGVTGGNTGIGDGVGAGVGDGIGVTGCIKFEFFSGIIVIIPPFKVLLYNKGISSFNILFVATSVENAILQ